MRKLGEFLGRRTYFLSIDERFFLGTNSRSHLCRRFSSSNLFWPKNEERVSVFQLNAFFLPAKNIFDQSIVARLLHLNVVRPNVWSSDSCFQIWSKDFKRFITTSEHFGHQKLCKVCKPWTETHMAKIGEDRREIFKISNYGSSQFESNRRLSLQDWLLYKNFRSKIAIPSKAGSSKLSMKPLSLTSCGSQHQDPWFQTNINLKLLLSSSPKICPDRYSLRWNSIWTFHSIMKPHWTMPPLSCIFVRCWPLFFSSSTRFTARKPTVSNNRSNRSRSRPVHLQHSLRVENWFLFSFNFWKAPRNVFRDLRMLC